MNKVIIFVLGATAGSLVTWKLLEKKYKQIADEEIEAVRDYYKKKDDLQQALLLDNKTEEVRLEERPAKEDKISYNKQITDLGYTSDDATIIVDQGEDYILPYVIAPEEFDTLDGFDTKSWTYYADGVLTDENDDIVMEPERIIGDGLEHFGEYEDDSVYVRNDNTECDYEILKHDKTFDEICARMG